MKTEKYIRVIFGKFDGCGGYINGRARGYTHDLGKWECTIFKDGKKYKKNLDRSEFIRVENNFFNYTHRASAIFC